jgi:hypothetical protein
MLGEKLSMFSTITILLGFGALAIILAGGSTSTSDDLTSMPMPTTFIPYLMLILLPLLSALGSIFLRKTPGLRTYTVAFYVNLANLPISGILMFTMFKNTNEGYEGFKFFGQIDTLAWIDFAFIGLAYIMADGSKYAAYTRKEPASL